MAELVHALGASEAMAMCAAALDKLAHALEAARPADGIRSAPVDRPAPARIGVPR